MRPDRVAPVVSVTDVGPTHVSLAWSSVEDGPNVWFNVWMNGSQGPQDIWDTATFIAQGQIMLLIFNITFFFIYLSIPIASHLIVSGASRPFRTL